jgi:molecular chaperone HtpG
VLLLTDPVDSFWVRTALGYDGKPFKSVTQGTADLDTIKLKDDAKKPDADEAGTATLIAAMKQALGDKVKDVRKSARLTDSAVCLVADAGMDRTLEKLLSRQKDTGVSVTAPILEINPGHPVVAALVRRVAASGAPSVADAAQLLLDQAFILEGEPVADPAGFSKRLAELMTKVFA